MRCPRCTLADISDATGQCILCGFAPGMEAAVATAEAPTEAAIELDARRELTREFRVEALLERRPGVFVYLARDQDQRAVALHALPRAALGVGAEERFRRAVAAAGGLDHPHVVTVGRWGATATFLWYATRFVEGRRLAEMLRADGAMDLSDALRILEQVASALDYAHRRGAVHGGLTSANVIVEANNWALVSDFAVAGLIPSVAGAAQTLSSPEPTPGDDQYSLAVLAYECLTGTVRAPDAGPLSSGDVGQELAAPAAEALRRALSARSSDRFPSVLDFVAALDGTRSPARTPLFGRLPQRGPGASTVIIDFDEEPRRGGRRIAAAVALVITLGGGAAWLGLSSTPADTPIPIPVASAPTPGAALDTTAPADSSLERATDLPPTTTPAPARAPAPAPAPSRPSAGRPRPERRAVVRRESARPAAPPAPALPAPATPTRVDQATELARLSVNAIPWGNVYFDGRLIGNTPLLDLSIQPGAHRLRVEREGFKPYERVLEVAPGQQVRITDIVLRQP